MGGSARVNYHVPNVLKIISRHLSFFKYRGRGVPWGPGALANIKCVAANIMRGAAVILHGLAVILRGMTKICSNVHDILHFQHQFFEIFLSVFGIFKGKNTLFSKSAQKMV